MASGHHGSTGRHRLFQQAELIDSLLDADPKISFNHKTPSAAEAQSKKEKKDFTAKNAKGAKAGRSVLRPAGEGMVREKFA